MLKSSKESPQNLGVSGSKSFRTTSKIVSNSNSAEEALNELVALKDRFLDDLSQLKLTLLVSSATVSKGNELIGLTTQKINECIQSKFQNLEKEMLSLCKTYLILKFEER